MPPLWKGSTRYAFATFLKYQSQLSKAYNAPKKSHKPLHSPGFATVCNQQDLHTHIHGEYKFHFLVNIVQYFLIFPQVSPQYFHEPTPYSFHALSQVREKLYTSSVRHFEFLMTPLPVQTVVAFQVFTTVTRTTKEYLTLWLKMAAYVATHDRSVLSKPHEETKVSVIQNTTHRDILGKFI